ncbi:MAG TPA: sugar ABC transporter ATP-binding protein [Acidimicrobiia bacterium]|nr:sugar ABC transporter ATP-binding protein [Acidimicrobiia bacterium]
MGKGSRQSAADPSRGTGRQGYRQAVPGCAGEVHALLGENGAGKSTLIKVIAGAVVPDGGELEVGGRSVGFGSPEQSRKAGISIVYQEMSLVASLSVSENVLLGRWPGRRGGVDWRSLRQQAKPYVDRVGLNVDPEIRVSRLGMAERQLVEIAKALSTDPRVLLLDEPTSALSGPEARRLFEIISDLTTLGVAVIYVSHRLREIMEIADRVTVLRDGRVVASHPVSEVTERGLARMVVGRELAIDDRVAETTALTGGAVVLEARNLGRPPHMSGVDLDLKSGEVVAAFGLVGSGRSELARVLFGLDPPTTGTIAIDGKAVTLKSPEDSIALGMGYVAPDRALGVVSRLSVAANLTLASYGRVGRGPLVDRDWEQSEADRLVDDLDIRVESTDQPAGSLSGGNQQKVTLGRWMCAGSRILILDDPTRGIDVGAKAEVFRLVRKLASDGASIFYGTSEIAEARQLGHRILVMAKGRVVGEFSPSATEDQIMGAAGGLDV